MKLNRSSIYAFILCAFFACSEDDSSSNNNADPALANMQPTGTSSRDLLSADIYKSLIVELVYIEGTQPSQTTINNFVSFLETRTFKPDGITVQSRAIPSPGTGPYTNQEITAIEDTNRTLYNTADRIAIWAFFADSESASNTGGGVVLGTAYRNTSFVIYEESIHGYSDSPLEPNRSVLETTVINHELGHLLGLTNLGATLQSDHEDINHQKHCDVDDCLMYYAAETGSGIVNMVSGGNVPSLDAQCIADLQANGGR